ncbi:MAG: hypothetical protein EA359_17850 [Balneolaceae bacterium]|nr:MAG: hypothetical protein EA359_17850 [Balneolaceae bacterium]
MNHSFFSKIFIFSLATLLVFLQAGCSTDSGPNHTFIATTIPEDGGTITPPSGTFSHGSRVEISAEPAEGFLFERWEGNLTGNENPVTLAFFGDRQVTAVFTTAPFAAGGDGSMANPYRVSTIDDLQAIDNELYLDKHFIQVSDIDASPSAEFQHGSGFKHIGDRETPFTGSYNGNGFIIRDLHLHIQRSSDQHTGIFGMIQNARLENITVDNSEQLERLKEPVNLQNASVMDIFQGEPFPPQYVDLSGARGSGFLVGFNDGGVIANCNVTAYIGGYISHTPAGLAGINNGIIESSSFEGFVGGGGPAGLVAFNHGIIRNSSAKVRTEGMSGYGLVALNNGEISDSYVIGDIQGTFFAVGIAWYNLENGFIIRSFATGEISSRFNGGALAGVNEGVIADSYSNMNITIKYLDDSLSLIAGGLVAENRSSGRIVNSYNAGQITIPDQADAYGGFAGINEGTITASYWDTQATGQNQGVGEGNPDGANGLTTQQMTGPAAETHMPEFDWNAVWRTTSGYPVLRWQGGE